MWHNYLLCPLPPQWWGWRLWGRSWGPLHHSWPWVTGSTQFDWSVPDSVHRCTDYSWFPHLSVPPVLQHKMYFRYVVTNCRWKKAWPFVWTNLNSLHPRKFWAKFGLYRSSGSIEVAIMLKVYDNNKNINEMMINNGHISIHQNRKAYLSLSPWWAN